MGALGILPGPSLGGRAPLQRPRAAWDQQTPAQWGSQGGLATGHPEIGRSPPALPHPCTPCSEGPIPLCPCPDTGQARPGNPGRMVRGPAPAAPVLCSSPRRGLALSPRGQREGPVEPDMQEAGPRLSTLPDKVQAHGSPGGLGFREPWKESSSSLQLQGACSQTLPLNPSARLPT